MMDYIANIDCPFCNEHDFDKIGLKYHLSNYCTEYKNTPDNDDNPCFSCQHRKPDERPYINICILDDKEKCIRE